MEEKLSSIYRVIRSGITFMSMVRHDALNSPGYNPAKISGPKLDILKQCAERAQSTFPPAFKNEPYEGSVESEVGNRALSKGRWAIERRKPAPRDSGSSGALGAGFPSMDELDEEPPSW